MTEEITVGAKIVLNGLEITVPVEELGVALAQLAPWLPAKQALDPVLAKRPEGGWPFPTGNKDQTAVHQAEKVSLAAAPAKVAPVFRAVKPDAKPPHGNDAASRAVALFKALRDHSASGGMSPDEVMILVGTEHPKGIGNRMQAINALLRDIGIPADEVYSNARNEFGTRVWVARQRIDEAINTINAMNAIEKGLASK